MEQHHRVSLPTLDMGHGTAARTVLRHRISLLSRIFSTPYVPTTLTSHLKWGYEARSSYLLLSVEKDTGGWESRIAALVEATLEGA
jgi:hypothetical protein